MWCFDIPSYEAVFGDGAIALPHYSKLFRNVAGWVAERGGEDEVLSFEQSVFLMERRLLGCGSAVVLPQEQLPFQTARAVDVIAERLAAVTDAGGEGLVLRKPGTVWLPERTHGLLKIKKYRDGEGTVVGFVSGLGKLRGMFGAMRLSWRGVTFEISGFTDEERRLIDPQLAWDAPGSVCSGAVHFNLGDRVTFRYRDVSRDGIPGEARYWRKS